MLISVAGILLPGVLGAFVSYGLYEFLLEPERRLATPFSSFILFTLVAMAITVITVFLSILWSGSPSFFFRPSLCWRVSSLRRSYSTQRLD